MAIMVGWTCVYGGKVEVNDLGEGCWCRVGEEMVWRSCAGCKGEDGGGEAAGMEVERMFEGVDGEIDLE